MEEKDNLINSKCPNCGSILKYDPKTEELKCESCGSTFPIESLGTGDLDEEEMDFAAALRKSKENASKEHVKSIKCQDCGASIRLDANQISSKCPFCGSNKTLVVESDEDVVPIIGVIPFTITNDNCNKYFKEFIKSKPFAPSKFKKEEHYPEFNPIYIPLYTFDANTFSVYHGQKGNYRDVTVRVRNSDGSYSSSTRREIDWYPISGTYSHSFDDVLVIGNNQKNYNYIEKINHYNFKKMEKFNEDFLLGYNAQRCSLPLDQGFDEAKIKMRQDINYGIRNRVHADEVKLDVLNTRYSNVTFKQIIVPIYNGIYTYRNKKYHFVVNGQTGNCEGSYPVSKFKISLVVLLVLAVVGLVIYLCMK